MEAPVLRGCGGMNPTLPFILTLQPSKEAVFEHAERVMKHFW